MLDDEYRLAVTFEFFDEIRHLPRHFRRDSRRRLIEQEEIFARLERPRDFKEAHLAAAETARLFLRMALESDHVERCVDDIAEVPECQALIFRKRFKRDEHVFLERHLPEDAEVLKHPPETLLRTDRRGNFGNIFAAEDDGARCRLQKTRNNVEERRLARSVRPDETDHLPFLHIKRDPVQDLVLLNSKGNTVEFQKRHSVNNLATEGGLVTAPGVEYNLLMGRETAEFERVKVNHHCHTTASDGSDAPEALLQTAISHNMILGVTDHQTVDGLKRLREIAETDSKLAAEIAKRILPGMEIRSEEGPELLVYGKTLDQAIDFFEKHIAAERDESNPLYAPTRLGILEIIALCREHAMEIGIPHFDSAMYGINALHPDDLKQVTEALEAYRDHVFVERNPHYSKAQNTRAIVYAMRHRFPVISGADSHDERHDESYTEIKLPAPDENTTAGERVFPQIHEHHPNILAQVLRELPMYRKLRNGMQIVLRNGIRITVYDLIAKIRRLKSVRQPS